MCEMQFSDAKISWAKCSYLRVVSMLSCPIRMLKSYTPVFHLADKTNSDMQLVSGQSASMFKHLISLLDEGPTEMMYEVLNGERYQCITLS